jgi:lipopolysaccharide transport system permease protein
MTSVLHTVGDSASDHSGAPVRNATAEPPPMNRHTILGDLREIVAELKQSKELVQQLTLRDIRVRYKQAVFGFAWALLLPMAVVLAGLAVRYAVAFYSGRGLAPGQVAGMIVKAVPWAFFVGCLNMTTPSLVANKSLVTKIYFPREVLPLSAVLAQSFDSLIGGTVILAVLPMLGTTVSVHWLWAPLLLVLLWVLALAAGLFLSCANIFFRDVKYMVQLFVTFGIFVTPVFMDTNMYGPKGSQIMMLNPLAPILEGLRLALTTHHNLLVERLSPLGFVTWRPWYLLYIAAWSLGGLFIAAIIFHRSERRFAELV